jgi:GTP pyrophosphokinase
MDAEPEVRWLRQLLELHTELKDPRSFLSGLKLDLYRDEIYVFSPKGDVYAFPRGATPLDFAYRIHTDIGHHCSGARVNGRLVPLRTELKTGDVVEILTQPGRHPSRDWLSQVVTSRAKSKIRHWLNLQQTAQAIEVGRKLFERELQRQGVSVRKVLDSERFRQLLVEEGLARPEDLFARLGYGKATLQQLLPRVLEKEVGTSVDPTPPSRLRQAWDRLLGTRVGGPIAVQGPGDLLTVLARCCRPVPGDEIIGFITRGRGISVHTVDCPNVRNLLFNPERQVDVTWSNEEQGSYLVTLRIETEDRQGMLARLTDAIARMETNIRQIEADTVQPGRGDIEVVIEVKNRKQLDRVKEALRNIPGVLEVTRSMAGSPRLPGAST